MTEIQQAGTLPRPGPLGRGVRLVLGIAVLWLFAGLVGDLPSLADGPNPAQPMLWIGLAYVVYGAPGSVNLLLSRSWEPARIRLGTGAALVAAGALDLLISGSFFGGAFGLLFGALLSLLLGLLGVSFVLAAATGAPG